MESITNLEGYWLSLVGVIALVSGFAAAWLIVAGYYAWTKHQARKRAEDK